MKTLVTFYSRTGNTRKAAAVIAEQLGADSDEIMDSKNRMGIMGWLSGGRDTMRKKPAKISYKEDPADYDMIIIGTPVWAGTMTPAVRQYLIMNKDRMKKSAFFCTYGGSESKTFTEMEAVSVKPEAALAVHDKDMKSELYISKIDGFCNRIKSSAGAKPKV